LSAVESAGILSKLEKAGFTLTKIEQAGLLSTAENLGLLAAAEDLLTANPATIASGSLPFIVAAVLSLSLIPHDNGITTFISYSLGATFAGVATAAVVAGFVVAALQEE
jgi:amino acid transporter